MHMATVVDSSRDQAWTNVGMSLSEDTYDVDYSFAEIYAGPRPDNVPKAEPLHMVADIFIRKQHQNTSPSLSCAVQVPASCRSDEALVKATLEDSHSDLSIRQLGSLSSRQEGDLADGFLDDQVREIERFLGSGNAADVDVDATVALEIPNPDASLSTRDPMDMNLSPSREMDISNRDLFGSFLSESGALPFCDPEDHISSPQSDFSGRHSSSSYGSTIEFSEEVQDQTSPNFSPPNIPRRKKGQCFACGKGSRLHRKETCLVCGAKYCSSCIVKAMGSMPEGRKCSTCVGQPICEFKRHKVGKATKVLCHLFSKLEVQQILKAEKECPSNQLRAEEVFVNGKQLNIMEFRALLSCQYPPSKLKPGSYWYDGQCGYWGKVREKPESIISVNLPLGDLSPDASAGSTRVFINNREITKVELRMLEFAGVQCPPNTRLWVDADGSYQEEGHGSCRGKIWEKATTRYICYFLSLPIPNAPEAAPEPPRPLPACFESTRMYKILLLGPPGSGTSTIFKQAKLLYGDDFTLKELQDMKALIQRNIYRYLIILLEARERFEDEENVRLKEVQENTPSTSSAAAGRELPSTKPNIYSLTSRLKDQADWFLQRDATGDLEKYYSALSREHASLIKNLWMDPAIQATYKRKKEIYMLPDVAGYFLEQVDTISSNYYMPDSRDILLTEGVTQEFGLADLHFSLEEDCGTSGPYHRENLDQSLAATRYHLVRINSTGITDSCKFFKMFDDVGAVLFCVALDSYDQMWSTGTDHLQNRMLLSRNMFDIILKHPSFRDKQMILLLNKYDSFEEKISTVPLTTCEWFSDFNPVKSSAQTPQTVAQVAYTYIAHKFKKHFEMVNPTGGKLYTFQLKAFENSEVRLAFQFLNNVLICEESRRHAPLPPQSSIYSEITTS